MTMTSTTIVTTTDSPIGPLTLTASEGCLTGLHMHEQRHAPPVSDRWVRDDAWFAPVIEQLDAYFSGDLTDFDVPLRMTGTEFQRRVWACLSEIPFGATISYGELARRVGSPGASRAVGLANGKNPVAIVVPCHRVIAAGGQIGGYGGGIERKVWLLDHEGAAFKTPA
jgi:methylated-DNA-[protein]-cysteine S-methyltransferase